MQTPLIATLPLAIMPAANLHNCEQSMSSAIQRAIILTSSSFKHALAHMSQALAHMLQASMQAVIDVIESFIISFSW